MLRFIFGASGSGKSFHIRQEIIERSIREPERNFLIVVPDQFTMQTQLDIVKQHPRHGIMNIDVISFSRLSHRIFEEVGTEHDKVLDDMGKSLVLRHVAEGLKDKLPVIGGSMHKMGYIDEVKSTISEFMQYSIEPEMLDEIISACENKGALKAKLLDLQLLYSEFKKYIKGNYIAQEELLDVLCRAIPLSKLISDSVIAFDGFTGFTPVQYKVIAKLLQYSSEVIFSCTIGQEDNPFIYDKNAEQDLFLLTKKTVHDLLRLEYENEKYEDPAAVPDFDRWADYYSTKNAIFLKNGEYTRHALNPELAFLEQHLFRYGNEKYELSKKVDEDNKEDGYSVEKGVPGECIRILEADTVGEEVQLAFSKIKSIIRSCEGMHYRDFAIVCGSLERYEVTVASEALKYDIPVYIDQTGNIKLNPLIEAIRSALLTVSSRYSYESVFHYLRSGLSPLSAEETDKLENYVRALGIRGKKGWENGFTKIPAKILRKPKVSDLKDSENDIFEELKKQYLDEINELRQRTVDSLTPLFNAEGGTVLDYSKALYDFLIGINAAEKVSEYETLFVNEKDAIRSKEYDVIYRRVMALLEQVTALMGDEKLTFKEYADILDVGFGDIEIGTIPQSVDRIVVGDIERTRLKEVKVLFFLGVNDDLIPKSAGTGGIISDIERQFLSDSQIDIELAPTPREQMYIQRLYLYMNLTKPSDRLYLSYSHIDNDGKSIRPAYLIGKVKSLFPNAHTERFDRSTCSNIIQTKNNGIDYVASHIQDYSRGYMTGSKEDAFLALYHSLSRCGSDDDRDRLTAMIDAAGFGYEHKALSESIAALLYSNYLRNSVSRLEKFAECSYAHFLQHGLGLDEREEFSFDTSDLGTVFHGALETFSRKLEEENLTWNDFDKEQGERLLDKALKEYTADYNGNILESSKRNEYLMQRIRRILLRSIDTLQYQLKKGSFVPKSMETSFDEAGEIDAININLTEDERGRILQRMRLTGRIDRIDTFEDADHVYIKVIDFKSGKKEFDLCALYYGLQLQLVMYMNVARGMAEAKNRGKEIVPAAILYYHLSDPVLEGDDISQDSTSDDINAKVRKQLRMKGLVQKSREVVKLLDREAGEISDVIPVKFKKDGDFAKLGSNVMTADDFEEVSGYVTNLIKESGRKIMKGDIEVNPYVLKTKNACGYCRFRSICGFDESVPGYCTRDLPAKKDEEILDLIRDSNR
ncbi:PD-(D/E)XK nuclease family protein [Butyrivibrio sp. AE3004]|uniref:PD-(D/E)XK nuclease family protein n=1 Tax=Butyrivibrio sp. AE3004 TaxID=1506994 RepID=UPI0004941A7F|nr:PD-(D/E)XK nuclease family protein [Butyrivibrio sp. AE3004]